MSTTRLVKKMLMATETKEAADRGAESGTLSAQPDRDEQAVSMIVR